MYFYIALSMQSWGRLVCQTLARSFLIPIRSGKERHPLSLSEKRYVYIHVAPLTQNEKIQTEVDSEIEYKSDGLYSLMGFYLSYSLFVHVNTSL